MLRLVANNTDDDWELAKLEKESVHMYCRRCSYGWEATIKQIIDNPLCPRCNSEV